jgi:SAM-dependent methyltransferase
MLGFNPVILFYSLRSIPFYIRSLYKIRRQGLVEHIFPFGSYYPVLHDRFSKSGVISGHYFHQDLFVARKIFEEKPVRHVDIGSRTDGFVAHVAVFREIEVMDIRKQDGNVKNVKFKQADLMQLPPNMINYCDSISSLHAIEHFGLGRYGDPIDYYGYIKALDNIYKILQQGGRFYFSVPIGRQRIEFNAHRVFSLKYLVNLFENKYQIDSFSYVNDQGAFFENVNLNTDNIITNFDCHYGCGIFLLKKK